MSAILTVESVAKRYRVQRNSPSTLKQLMLRKLTRNADGYTDVWALKDVTFALERGRSLGILGHNGAGKSSLIRLVCGLGRPTLGTIRSQGRIRGLLELGGGFHPELTGRQNIMTGGLLNGLSRSQVHAKEEEIIAFAELEEFIDQAARTYSTGMYLRLAFASAAHLDIDTLAIDEVLAVGDMKFQRKCLDRLRCFRAEGKSLIVASHVLDHIRTLCDEVLVLEDGQVMMSGDVESGIQYYNDLLVRRTERRATELRGQGAQFHASVGDGKRHGTQEATISSVTLCNTQGRSVHALHSGESLTIRLEYTVSEDVTDMAISLGLFTETNVKCFETSIPSAISVFGQFGRQGVLVCHVPCFAVLSGRYFVNVGLYPPDGGYVYDYHWQLHSLDVLSESGSVIEVSGVVALNPSWSASSE